MLIPGGCWAWLFGYSISCSKGPTNVIRQQPLWLLSLVLRRKSSASSTKRPLLFLFYYSSAFGPRLHFLSTTASLSLSQAMIHATLRWSFHSLGHLDWHGQQLCVVLKLYHYLKSTKPNSQQINSRTICCFLFWKPCKPDLAEVRCFVRVSFLSIVK